MKRRYSPTCALARQLPTCRACGDDSTERTPEGARRASSPAASHTARDDPSTSRAQRRALGVVRRVTLLEARAARAA
jgi:hypothetical protein